MLKKQKERKKKSKKFNLTSFTISLLHKEENFLRDFAEKEVKKIDDRIFSRLLSDCSLCNFFFVVFFCGNLGSSIQSKPNEIESEKVVNKANNTRKRISFQDEVIRPKFKKSFFRCEQFLFF